jgi:hypothetical protein
MADWRNNLGSFLASGEKKSGPKEPPFQIYVREILVPAFEEIAEELDKHGRTVKIHNAGSSAAMTISVDGTEEMTYRIRERQFPNGPLPYAEVRVRERKGLRLVTVETMLRSGQPDYTLDDISKQEIIDHFLQQYISRVKPR